MHTNTKISLPTAAAAFLLATSVPASDETQKSEMPTFVDKRIVANFKEDMSPIIKVWVESGKGFAEAYAENSDLFEQLLSEDALVTLSELTRIGRRWKFDMEQIENSSDLLLVLPFWMDELDILIKGWPELQAFMDAEGNPWPGIRDGLEELEGVLKSRSRSREPREDIWPNPHRSRVVFLEEEEKGSND